MITTTTIEDVDGVLLEMRVHVYLDDNITYYSARPVGNTRDNMYYGWGRSMVELEDSATSCISCDIYGEHDIGSRYRPDYSVEKPYAWL